MARWVVEAGEVFGGGGTQNYLVRKTTDPEYANVHVWVYKGSPVTARCCHCSGPLSAMLTTCRHASAVKRFLARQAQASRARYAIGKAPAL